MHAQRGGERLLEEHPDAVHPTEDPEPEQKSIFRTRPEEMPRDGCRSRRADNDGHGECEQIDGRHGPVGPGLSYRNCARSLAGPTHESGVATPAVLMLPAQPAEATATTIDVGTCGISASDRRTHWRSQRERFRAVRC